MKLLVYLLGNNSLPKKKTNKVIHHSTFIKIKN